MAYFLIIHFIMLEHERFGHGCNRAQTSFPNQGPGPSSLEFTSMKMIDIECISNWD